MQQAQEARQGQGEDRWNEADDGAGKMHTYLDQKAAVALLGDHDHRVMQLLIKVDMALGAFCIMACRKADTPDSGLIAYEESGRGLPGLLPSPIPVNYSTVSPPRPLRLPFTSSSIHCWARPHPTGQW